MTLRPFASNAITHTVSRWLSTTLALGLFVIAAGTPAQAQSAASAREDLVAKLAGARVYKDATTRQVRAITADEARDLIAAVIRATDTSALENRTAVRSAVGQMLRLDGHAGHIVVARPHDDESVATRCVGSADEAVTFLLDDGLPLQ